MLKSQTIKHRIYSGALACCMGMVVEGAAQDTQPRKVTALTPGRVVESAPTAAPTQLPGIDATPSRVTRGEQLAVSAEVRAQLQKFDVARDAYLKRQRELAEQLRGSTTSERRQVRARMEELRKHWLEASIQLRREAQARIPDLRNLSRFEALGPAKAAADEAKRDRRIK